MLNSRLPLLCAFFITLLFFTSCTKAEPSRAEFVLGTVCSVTLYDQAKTQVYRDIFNRLREIEDRMSVNLPDTDLAHVNAAAGIAPVQVHDDVFEVIERALFYAEISGGAFDPTVGPLVSLWGIGGDNPRVPTQAEIDAVLPLVNWRDVELDRERRSVFLRQPGMAIDLGGIAKGYAADEAAAIVRKARLKRAIIDLGGNILTYGERQDGRPWRVGIQNPLDNRGAYLGIVEVRDRTVVTSGVYERNFEADGLLYHHIFSPSNGYPAANGLLSVTIIADSSIDADALSTAVFVMGYKRGLALLESLEGIEGIFVFEDMSVRKTEGMDFVVTDEGYRLLAGGED
jgi:thiamine biosynthesis lipoprotein